jgi:eukaryotic-like serine/threonine-protein kinase
MLLLTAALLGLGWWQTTRSVDHPLLRFSVDLGPDALSRTRMSAAISPDGRRIVFPVRSGSGRGQLATRLLDQSNATVLPSTEGGRDPFFKPDGQWIGFFADNKLKKISMQGGAVITLCDLTANNGDRGASWGDDDMIIATLDAHHLFRVPAGGGKPELLRTMPQQTGQIDYRWPQVLPRSETAIVTAGIVGDFDNAGIAAVSLKTGNVRIVAQGGYFGRYLDSGHLIYIHEGTLFGVPFDSKRLETRGTPAPILEDMLGAGATNGAGQLDFSKNGTFVYRSDNSQRGILEVALIDAEGKKTPLSMPSGAVLTPRFSPDGKRVAIAVNGDIFVQDLERGAITRITVTATDNRYPVWTPAGTHIVYSSRGSIWWTRADGSAMPKRILETKSTVASGSFSPDGQRLAFVQSGEGGLDIWILPLNVSEPENPKPGAPELFLATAGADVDPAFSPDGRWLAYASTETAQYQVYVRPYPATGGGGKWLISGQQARFPMWSRNDNELFYEELTGQIMAAGYTSKGGIFIPGKSRKWSSIPILATSVYLNPDLSPDGKRLVVFPAQETAAEERAAVHVNFLLNFFDEMKRRMP